MISEKWAWWKEPADAMAELNVIGRCLVYPSECAPTAIARLRAEDFGNRCRSAIFACIIALSERNAPIGPIEVTYELKVRFPELWNEGSKTAVRAMLSLEHALEAVTGTANMEYFADQIREHARKRWLREQASKVPQLDLTRLSPDEAQAEIQALFAEDLPSNSTATSLGDLAAQFWNECETQAVEQKRSAGISTGLPPLDDRLGPLSPGQNWLVACRPGGGKSAFLLQVAEAAALSGHRALLFSLEMSGQDLVARTFASSMRVQLQLLRDPRRLSQASWEEMRASLNNLERTGVGNRVEVVAQSRLHVDDLRKMALHARARGPIDLVLVDYAQLVLPQRGQRFNNREGEVANVSRNLKMLAGELGAVMLVAAQLNRAVDSRQDKWPVLSDLRESGALEADADGVIFLHRQYLFSKNPDDLRAAAIDVAKNRHGPLVRLENVEFDPVRVRFGARGGQ